MVRESLHRPRLTNEQSEMERLRNKAEEASPSSSAFQDGVLDNISTINFSKGIRCTKEKSRCLVTQGGNEINTACRRPSLDEEIQCTIDELKNNSLSLHNCSASAPRSSLYKYQSFAGGSGSDTTTTSNVTIKEATPLFKKNMQRKTNLQGPLTTTTTSVKAAILASTALAVPKTTTLQERKVSTTSSTHTHSNSQQYQPFRTSRLLSSSLNGRKDLVDADEEEDLVSRALEEEKTSGAMKSEEMAVLQMLDQMTTEKDTPTSVAISQSSYASAFSTLPRPKAMRFTPSKVSITSNISNPDSPTRMSVRAVASAVNQGVSLSPFNSPSRDRLLAKLHCTDDIENESTVSKQGGVKKAVMEREKLDSPTMSFCNSMTNAREEFPSSPSENHAGIGTYMASVSSRSKSASPNRLSTSPQRRPFQLQGTADNSISSSYASQTNAFLNRRPTHAADRRLTHSPGSSLLFSSGDESASSFWSRKLSPHDSPETDATSPPLSGESDSGSNHKVQPKITQQLLSNHNYRGEIQSKSLLSVRADDSKIESKAMAESTATSASDKMSDKFKDTPKLSPSRKMTTMPLSSVDQITTLGSSLLHSDHCSAFSAVREPRSPSKISTPKKAKDLIRLYEANDDISKPPLTPTQGTPTASLIGRNLMALNSPNEHLTDVSSPAFGPPVPPKKEIETMSSGMIKITPRKPVNHSLSKNGTAQSSSFSSATHRRSIVLTSTTPTASSRSITTSKSALSQPQSSTQEEERISEDDFGPPSPPSDVQFSWLADTDRELLPADSASQRVARTPTMSSRYTAIPIKDVFIDANTFYGLPQRTAAQKIRDSVISQQNSRVLSTVNESMSSIGDSKDEHFTSEKKDIASSVSAAPLAFSTDDDPNTKAKEASSSSTSSQEVALVLQYLERQNQERLQREIQLDSQLQSFQGTLSALMEIRDAPPPIEKDQSFQSKGERVSQAIQTPMMEEDQRNRNADLAAVLAAIKDNERAREAQQKQQHEIARYLNELNNWLERDVVDRTNEWKTLAMGVTKLHEELNQLKTEQAMDAANNIAKSNNLLGIGNIPAHPDGAVPGLPGPSGSRTMQQLAESTFAHVDENIPSKLLPERSIQDQMIALGMNPPAPIMTPSPSSTIKRSGTRTWRAEAAPGAMRNNDVWAGGPIKIKERKNKEEKKAEGRARRRSAFADSSAGRIALAAGGVALLRAATHEYEKYKERQRSEGRPEEASLRVDEKTGKFEKKEHVPTTHVDKMKEAIVDGDEGKIREAIKEAAEVGAGTAAIHKLMDWIKGGHRDEDLEDDNADEIQASQATSHSAKSSRGSEDGSMTTTLRDAVEGMSTSSSGGGAALALAVEEILKHLLEKKEEEKKLAKEAAEAEAAKQAKLKEEEEEREKKLIAMREQEKNDLVEAILAKLQQEKSRQDQETVQKQRELDPKSAIESLVVAINQQRSMDAAQHANADAAIKQLASEVVRTSTEQSGQLVEAVHSAAREMLRTNIESHAEELKNTLTKEVSNMFEDVGKIRETKRSLEQEIADLFLIKSKHLSDVAAAPIPSLPQDLAPPAPRSEVGSIRGPTPTPLFPAISNMFRPPTTLSAPKPLPHPQPPAQWCPPSLQPVQQQMAPLPPMLNPHELQMLNQAKTAMPSFSSIGPPKRDLIGPLSINFGPRRK